MGDTERRAELVDVIPTPNAETVRALLALLYGRLPAGEDAGMDDEKRKPDPERSLIGRIGANTRWSQTEDRTAATQPARDALMRKFEDEVDPERKLAPQERAKRAEAARLAHYQRMALKSAQARRAKRSQ